MEIILLVGRVSLEESHSPNDIIDVSDTEAYALISSNQAQPKIQKEYTALVKRLEAKEKREENKAQKLLAIQKEEELKAEATALLTELIAVVDTIKTIDPEYKLDFVLADAEPFDLSEISSTKKED